MIYRCPKCSQKVAVYVAVKAVTCSKHTKGAVPMVPDKPRTLVPA